MRLWHYELIPVLPNKMLVSQWRECIAIKRQWEKGTLKHRLVSYVMNYNRECFMYYVVCVVQEMRKRKIKYQEKYYSELCKFCEQDKPNQSFLIYLEHNNRYLKQCLYNLKKTMRNIISKEEWQKYIINLKILQICGRRINEKRTIYISCLLKDNMIISYKISGNLKKFPHDYYKDFYYSGNYIENCDELYEVKYMSIKVDEDISTYFNNYIFEEFAKRFYMQWEIHPEHWGSKAY